jgi:cobalamin biosynthesis protein CobD/CbiB
MTKPGRSPAETLLAEAFAASRRDTYEPDAPADPSRIWWRARADELVEEEIRRRKRTAAPFAIAQGLTGAALFLIVEIGLLLLLSYILPPIAKPLAAVGLSPLTVTILALAAGPTAAFLLHLGSQLRSG